MAEKEGVLQSLVKWHKLYNPRVLTPFLYSLTNTPEVMNTHVHKEESGIHKERSFMQKSSDYIWIIVTATMIGILIYMSVTH